jgi:hypothetical protein
VHRPANSTQLDHPDLLLPGQHAVCCLSRLAMLCAATQSASVALRRYAHASPLPATHILNRLIFLRAEELRRDSPAHSREHHAGRGKGRTPESERGERGGSQRTTPQDKGPSSRQLTPSSAEM